MPLSGENVITVAKTENEQVTMNSQLLKDIVKLLFADHKGLLAMDESNGTCNKRFEKLGIPQTVEARRAYRELIVTTPGPVSYTHLCGVACGSTTGRDSFSTEGTCGIVMPRESCGQQSVLVRYSW